MTVVKTANEMVALLIQKKCWKTLQGLPVNKFKTGYDGFFTKKEYKKYRIKYSILVNQVYNIIKETHTKLIIKYKNESRRGGNMSCNKINQDCSNCVYGRYKELWECTAKCDMDCTRCSFGYYEDGWKCEHGRQCIVKE